MSERTDPTLPHQGFDGLEEELATYSKLYLCEQPALEPSAQADAAILAASRREIQAGPLLNNSAAAMVLAQRRARAKAWKVPLSLAAMLILCGTIGIALWHDQRAMLTPGALSEPMAPAPAPKPQSSGAITGLAPPLQIKPQAPALTPIAPDRQNLRERSALPAAALASTNSIVTGSSFRDAPVVVQTHQDFAARATPDADATPYQSTATAPRSAGRASAKTAPGVANAPLASMAPIAPLAPAAPMAPAAAAPGAALAEPAQPIVVVPVLPAANAPAPRALRVNPLAIVTEVPLAGSAEQLLIAALSAAVDRGDTQATRDILESLHQQYPQAVLTPQFAARVAALGLDPAH